MNKGFVLLAALALSACASYEWSGTGSSGEKLDDAKSWCRAEAREVLRKNEPIGSSLAEDPFNYPAAREGAEMGACLKRKGFRQERVD